MDSKTSKMNEINPSFNKRIESFNIHSSRSVRGKFLHPLCSNLFIIQLSYLITISLVGYLALSVLSETSNKALKPKELDLFFTSVSATTLSSMSTLEMEVFSNTQLIVLTVLMIFGGEVFTSMMHIQIVRSKLRNKPTSDLNDTYQKHNSLTFLSYVVLAYFLVVNVVGFILVYGYVRGNPTLESKGIGAPTFSVFATVSSFTNCGFIPTNENMVVFKRDSVLLLILTAQILLGNTLYPPSLRFGIWVIGKVTRKKREVSFLLRNPGEVGYDHLFSGTRSKCLALTVLGFLLLQITVFCATEWRSEAMNGLSSSQKLVASLFQVVNSRHAGESVVDLSAVSAAVSVLFVIMMYLPPHTSFVPKRESDSTNGDSPRKSHFTLSQLSYLAIFLILICITERERLRIDPLNFNIFNIITEIISAYGNVGFSSGYSCKRQVNPEMKCVDKWYGFAGRWSSSGKVILIIVMFFGRLKKFTIGGGKAWITVAS